jgi:hypothetical protein
MKEKTIAVILALSLTFISCGYTISGSGKLFPENIKTIYIPEFDNVSTAVAATLLIGSAVTEKFIRRSGLKRVNKRSIADSMLEGRIIQFNVIPLLEQATEDKRPLNLKISLSLRFIDLTKNSIIYENQKFIFSHQYENETEDFFDQEKETQFEIADKLAAKVVTAILENF